MKRIVMIHTVPVIIEGLSRLVEEKLPGIEVENILDERLLKLVKSDRAEAKKRLERLVDIVTEDEGIRVIVTCSSLSEICNGMKNVEMIDSFMHKACCSYGRILLAATAKTALKPTKAGVMRVCGEEAPHMEEVFIEGAMDENLHGRRECHDELVMKRLRDRVPLEEYDGIVLCQASMAHMKEGIERELGIEVLTNTQYFIENLREGMKGR